MGHGFAILDHPADIGIEAYGDTLAQAFEQAAIGMMAIIVELSSVNLHEIREIILLANDKEQLLVKWLTEILYLYDGQQFIPKEFTIHSLNSTSLTAIIRGEPLSAQRHQTLLDVKAVTYHQLFIEEKNDGAMVRVYLDI